MMTRLMTDLSRFATSLNQNFPFSPRFSIRPHVTTGGPRSRFVGPRTNDRTISMYFRPGLGQALFAVFGRGGGRLRLGEVTRGLCTSRVGHHAGLTLQASALAERSADAEEVQRGRGGQGLSSVRRWATSRSDHERQGPPQEGAHGAGPRQEVGRDGAAPAPRLLRGARGAPSRARRRSKSSPRT